jgi:tRNA threonylcarbamoyl adenosine modification protein YeaZ
VLLLAFDTATPAVTVALHDGARPVAQESAVDARRHGELLAVAIDKVLRSVGAEPGDLTAIAVGTGPGPYTGLRAGLVTARVLGSALGIRVDGICTLDVIAAAAVPQAAGREFLVATDARRKELYWARYSALGGRLTDPDVCPAAELPVGDLPVAELRAAGFPGGLPVAGEGALLYPGLAAEPIEPRYPAASQLAALAAERIRAGTPAEPPEPLYLRRPDAREPGRPKRVTP